LWDREFGVSYGYQTHKLEIFTMPTKAMSRDPANLQVLIQNKIDPVSQTSIGESV